MDIVITHTDDSWSMIHIWCQQLIWAMNVRLCLSWNSKIGSSIHPSILILVIIYYRSNQQTYIFCLWKWFEANFFQQQIKNKQNNVLRVIIGFSRLLWLTPPEMEYCADSGHTHTFHINCLCFSNEITMLRAMVEFPRKKKDRFVCPPAIPYHHHHQHQSRDFCKGNDAKISSIVKPQHLKENQSNE